MKAIVVPQLAFDAAFRQAEYDLNKAIHDADRGMYATPADRLAADLAAAQVALLKLRDRLIETQP